MAIAPAIEKVAQVARLETLSTDPLAPGHRDASFKARRQRIGERFFSSQDVGLIAVAQHVNMKPAALSSGGQPLDHPAEVARQPLGVFVPDTDRDRGGTVDRLIAPNAAQVRRHQTFRVSRERHQQKADQRIPEPNCGPGQREHERGQHGDAPAIDARGQEKRCRHQGEQSGGGQEHQRGEQHPAPGQPGRLARGRKHA